MLHYALFLLCEYDFFTLFCLDMILPGFLAGKKPAEWVSWFKDAEDLWMGQGCLGLDKLDH